MDDELLHELHWIDAIRRLGVSYHFEREIEEALHNVYELECQVDQTLEATSLRFRLLRENGFTVLCGACFLRVYGVGLTSAATSVLNVTSLVGMEDALTPDIFNWAFNNPKIIVVGSIHARLFDDIVSHKFEQERGHSASAVECYMREYGVSEEKKCMQ
ncbi:hypothetical protein GQ457_06G009640 [Hibiscus cannabinus]